MLDSISFVFLTVNPLEIFPCQIQDNKSITWIPPSRLKRPENGLEIPIYR